MIALGGAAAEELFYGDRSTGSRGDFDQAMSIVRSMVESGLTELGITDSSMMTPDKWAIVNSSILDELMSRVKVMLGEQKEVFLRSLEVLKTEETLSGDRFRTLLGIDLSSGGPDGESQTA
jgi:ATP-dependent Zn protease